MVMSRGQMRDLLSQRVYDNMPVITSLKLFYPIVNSPKGRTTQVILDIKGKRYFGIAICGKGDNFCKKTGRKLAILRACRQYWNSLKCKK